MADEFLFLISQKSTKAQPAQHFFSIIVSDSISSMVLIFRDVIEIDSNIPYSFLVYSSSRFGDDGPLDFFLFMGRRAHRNMLETHLSPILRCVVIMSV